jgi:hypothetical protein
MENSMSFKWDRAFSGMLTALLVVLGPSADLQAAEKNTTKEKPGPFAFVFPKDLNLTNPIDFYASAAAVIFQAQQDGVAFALKNRDISGVDPVGAETISFSGENSNWSYNVGTRANAGFYFDHDAWNVDFTWTWFHVPDSAKTHGNAIIPLWINQDYHAGSLASRQTAHGTWDCNYHVLDAHLAKPYYVSRMLIFNPHFGLRFAWIDQKLSAHFNNITPTATSLTMFHGKNDFFGLGARVGLDTTWLIGCEWKLFCNVAASILSGKFDTSQKVDYPSASSNSRSFSNDFHMNVPNLDIALGFDWGTYLYDKKYYLDFIAGYEFQVWWDQFNLKNMYLGNATQGNFTLNGFTFKIQLDM